MWLFTYTLVCNVHLKYFQKNDLLQNSVLYLGEVLSS